jgi:phospholipid/cholesterol/gamma-HCH transport system substrate-binding protein
MSRQFRVGLFVIAGLALITVTIFLIGSSRQIWKPKRKYVAAFQDVAGLRSGSPVRMGGLDIGSVTKVGYDSDANDERIFVTLEINKAEAGRIKSDTVAIVEGKGLLGDKMVVLSVGSPGAPVLDPKDLIRSGEPQDLFSAVNKTAETARQTIRQLQPLAEALGNPKFSADVTGSLADVHELLDTTVHADGPMHRLFYDQGASERLDRMLANLDRTTGRLDALVGELQDVSAHVEKGPGLAHALIYDENFSADAAGAVRDLHNDLKAVGEGNGVAHSLLYGDKESDHLMANLDAISGDVRAIVGNVRSGKGTLGGLLVDPTIYEDIRRVVGNVQRNDVLRALVRYSIRADEAAAKTPQVDRSPK